VPATSTTFKGFSEIGTALLNEQLEDNLISFFNWAFLNIGAFYNIRRSTLAPYGGDPSRLRPVNDPNFANGQVWEGYRGDWVWETGIPYSTQPINISGVWVDSVFYPSNTAGTYAHIVNYPAGRIIFNNPISTTKTVTAEYSYRMFKIDTANVPWYKQVQPESMRVDNSNFLQIGSGQWDTMWTNRLQLPAIVVDVVPDRALYPLQIGGGQRVRQAVDIQIIAENPWDRQKLIDIFTYQKEHAIMLYDKNYLNNNNIYPLDISGSRVSNAKNYATLVLSSGDGGAAYKKMYIADTVARKGLPLPSLFTGVVRFICETELYEI